MDVNVGDFTEKDGKSHIHHPNTEIVNNNENADKPSADVQIDNACGVNLGVHGDTGHSAVTGLTTSNKQISGDFAGRGISGNAEVVAHIAEAAGYLG